jgi:hypothetical protein
MCEAIKVWYFILDICSKSALEPIDLFKKYAIKYGIELKVVEGVFQSHATFVMCQMNDNKEEVNWENQPVFQYIRDYLACFCQNAET